MQMETLDFNKKILHASWHPRESTIAVYLISYFRCGRIADIHLDSSDCCNKQPVLIQRRMMSVVVLVGSIVQLCVVVCCPPSVLRGVCLFVPSVLQYISWPLLFTSLTLRHLTSPLLPVAYPLPLVSVQAFPSYTVFKRRTHATSEPSLPSIFDFTALYLTHSIPLTPSAFSLAPTHISQCRVNWLTRQEVRKRRITIRICIFLESPPKIVMGESSGYAARSTSCAHGGVVIVRIFVAT